MVSRPKVMRSSVGWVLPAFGMVVAAGMGGPVDQDIREPLAFEGIRLELNGVCRISEAEVECWKPDRTLDPGLARQVDAQFVATSSLTFPARPTEQTRLAIFTLRQPRSVDSSASIRVTHDEHGPSAYWPGRADLLDDANSIRQEAIVVTAPLGAEFGVARAEVNRSTKGTTPFPVQVGAVWEYAGWMLTVRQITPNRGKDRPRSARGGNVDVPTWKIRCTVEQSIPRQRLVFQPLDSHRLTIRAVDGRGRPSQGEPYPSEPQTHGSRRARAFPAFVQDSDGYYGQPPELMVDTSVDPKHLAFVRLGAEEGRSIRLTGIPLEPIR